MKKHNWTEISLITGIRTVLNTGYRMVYPYQPIWMNELGIGLGVMSRMLAGQSLIGGLGPLFASLSDTRGRKTGMLSGLLVFSLGALTVVFFPTVVGFLIFLLLSILGKAIFDPSIQAYFGDHVPYQQRGFVLAITEMSWSGAFFLGVPLVGFLLNQRGFSAPFLLLAVLALTALLGVALIIPADPVQSPGRPSVLANFGIVFRSRSALAGLSLTALICTANQLVNVVFGVWLDRSFAFQITALGGASVVIGLSELIGEGGVSVVSDRLSKKKAVLVGVLGSILSAILLPLLGRSPAGAFLGLFLFYLTFEFTIVSIIPLMTGVLPEARGTIMAMNGASASLGRGLGSYLAAPLFAGGFGFIAAGAVAFNLLSLISLQYILIKEH